MKNTFSASDTLKSAWQLFLIHKKFYLKTVLIFGAIALIADWMADDKSGRLIDLALSLISTVSYWYGTIILMKASLAVTSGKSITEDASRISWSLVFSLILGSILVGIGSFIGFILLIVPGVIFALRASLTQYIILDQNEKAVPAIKKSLALTKGYFWSFFRLMLCFVVLGILSVVPLIGLGFIVLIPVSTLALSLIYRKLQMGTAETVSAPAQAPQV
jgi:uncharacterized membrane protein